MSRAVIPKSSHVQSAVDQILRIENIKLPILSIRVRRRQECPLYLAYSIVSTVLGTSMHQTVSQAHVINFWSTTHRNSFAYGVVMLQGFSFMDSHPKHECLLHRAIGKDKGKRWCR